MIFILDKIINKIEVYYNMHRYEQALECIDEGLSIEPENGWLLYIRGTCLLNLDRYKEALESTQAALKSSYSKERCLYQLGNIYMYSNHSSEAEKCFLEVLSMNPNEQRTLAVYGQMLFSRGKQKRGLTLIEKALSINLNDPVVLRVAFYCYLRLYKRSKQKKMLEAYIEKSSDEVGKLIIEGEYEIQRRKFKEAHNTFSHALTLDPTNKAVLSKLIDLKYSTKGFCFFNKIPIAGYALLGYYLCFVGPFYTMAGLFERIVSDYPKYADLLTALYKYAGISIILIVLFFIYAYVTFMTCVVLGRKEKKAAGVDL